MKKEKIIEDDYPLVKSYIRKKKPRIGDRRIGRCRHSGVEVVQEYDGVSNDAVDEFGWCCLHWA